MCFELLKYLKTRLITHSDYHQFKQSFWYEDWIETHFKRIEEFPQRFRDYNHPQALSSSVRHGNYVIRNYHFLARRMLAHLDKVALAEKFSERKEIRILSIGCGYCFDFIPLNTYFAYRKINVRYVGIDIDQEAISASQNTFKNFDNIELQCRDIAEFNEEQKFDLVVIQHPNLKHFPISTIEILKHHVFRFLNEDGHIYTSIYYPSENETFKQQILEVSQRWKQVGSVFYIEKDDSQMLDVNDGESFMPEQFVYCTEKPYRPKYNISFT